MKKIFIVIYFIILSFWGCKKENTTVPTTTQEFSNDILSLATIDEINFIRQNGVEVYGGNTPPDLDGTFLYGKMYTLVNGKPDKPYFITWTKYRFYGLNKTAGTISYDYKWTSSSTVNGSYSDKGAVRNYISGSGNNFSLWQLGSGGNFIVISGTKTSKGIENMKTANYATKLNVGFDMDYDGVSEPTSY
jgi:hypothetical protein